MDTLNVATVASNTIWKDKKKNIENTEMHIKELLRLFPKTQIILFPEISLMGYVVDDSNQEIAESIDGYCVSEIKRIAKENHVAVISGMIEKGEDEKPHNTEFVVNKEGNLLARYRKNHLFTESPEPKFYSHGKELTTFD